MTKTMTKLQNGLRIVTDSMQEVETVSLGVWVGVGAMFETPEINGISHLLEHMAFKGTTSRTARQIAEQIEDVGGYINACTSRDSTAYYIKLLKEDVALGVDILADILQNSVFDEEEFAREKTVVLQEISQSIDTPDDIIFDHFQSKAYPDQPVGRPILGSVQTVNAITTDTLKSFLKNNYTPERMIVSASGKVDHETFVTLVSKAFGGLKPVTGLVAEPALYKGGEHREKKAIEQVNIVLGFQGVSFFDPAYYTSHILSTIFGGGMSSRLFQEIREKKGLVYSIYSFSSSFATSGLFGIYAGTGQEEAGNVLPAICHEIKRMKEVLSEDELNRAKAQLKSSVLMALESPSARAEQNANHLLVFDRLIETQEILEKIANVTPKAVLDLANQIFVSPPTLATLGPVKKVMPYDKIIHLLH